MKTVDMGKDRPRIACLCGWVNALGVGERENGGRWGDWLIVVVVLRMGLGMPAENCQDATAGLEALDVPRVVDHPLKDLMHLNQTSNIKHQTSNIKHQTQPIPNVDCWLVGLWARGGGSGMHVCVLSMESTHP